MHVVDREWKTESALVSCGFWCVVYLAESDMVGIFDQAKMAINR